MQDKSIGAGADIQQALREQLRDIQLPEPVSWWPPALGWWLLTAVLVVVAVVITRLLKVKQAKWRFQRESLARLEASYRAWQQTEDADAYIDSASALLRQIAIAYGGRARVAHLSGDPYLAYLGELSVGGVGRGMQRHLGTDRYRKNRTAIDVDTLHNEFKLWLKGVRKSAGV